MLPIDNFDIRHLLKDVKVKDVMTAPCATINKEENLSLVEEMFIEKRIRHLPVVDSAHRLVGLITKRDLFRTVSPRKSIDGKVSYSSDKLIEKSGVFYEKETLDNFILSKIMIQSVLTLKESSSIADAIHLMVAKKLGCIPVVSEENKVLGIITRFDILKMADQIVQS